MKYQYRNIFYLLNVSLQQILRRDLQRYIHTERVLFLFRIPEQIVHTFHGCLRSSIIMPILLAFPTIYIMDSPSSFCFPS